MGFRRAFAITKRIFRTFRHDKRSLAMILFAPVMAMFIFGIAFGGDVEDVKVIVINEDEGYYNGSNVVSLSDQVISEFDDDLMDIKYSDDLDEAQNEVEDGRAWAVIYFPSSFTYDVLATSQNNSYVGNTSIILQVDKTNVNINTALNKEVQDSILEVVNESGYRMPIEIDSSEPIYGKNTDFSDFLVPGVMVFAAFLLTVLLTLLTFVQEKTSDTLDRILATPIKEHEIVFGYAMAFGMLGLIQSSILLIIASIVFGITILGNPILAYLVIAILAVTSQSLGMLLSSLAQREAQAVQFIPFIILIMFISNMIS